MAGGMPFAEAGVDRWAMHHGYISVTPLQPCFAEPPATSMSLASDKGTVAHDMGGAHEFVL
jgi:hypothetical protein